MNKLTGKMNNKGAYVNYEMKFLLYEKERHFSICKCIGTKIYGGQGLEYMVVWKLPLKFK